MCAAGLCPARVRSARDRRPTGVVALLRFAPRKNRRSIVGSVGCSIDGLSESSLLAAQMIKTNRSRHRSRRSCLRWCPVVRSNSSSRYAGVHSFRCVHWQTLLDAGVRDRSTLTLTLVPLGSRAEVVHASSSGKQYRLLTTTSNGQLPTARPARRGARSRQGAQRQEHVAAPAPRGHIQIQIQTQIQIHMIHTHIRTLVFISTSIYSYPYSDSDAYSILVCTIEALALAAPRATTVLHPRSSSRGVWVEPQHRSILHAAPRHLSTAAIRLRRCDRPRVLPSIRSIFYAAIHMPSPPLHPSAAAIDPACCHPSCAGRADDLARARRRGDGADGRASTAADVAAARRWRGPVGRELAPTGVWSCESMKLVVNPPTPRPNWQAPAST